ncbi:MAG: glycosyltransferase family 39 protein [Bacteroidetes bacterium]|nr:glycosyltransferase family 39 protein [Bacteroidota bacterium]
MQHLFALRPVELYTVSFIAASAAYLVLAMVLHRKEISQRWLYGLLALGLLIRVVLLPLPPVGSDDMYRYLWEGKVQAAGINPYRYAPDAPELEPLHSPLLPSSVNHPSMKTVYFPFTQWVFWLGYQISGEETWGLKLMLLVAETVTLVLLFILLKRRGTPEKFVLLYALCPLPILQFGLDGHIDGLGLPLLLLALLLWLRDRKSAALLLLGLSMSIKPVALVLLPMLFFLEKDLRSRVRVLLLPFVPLAMQFVPYLISADPFEGLAFFGTHWTFNGAVFEMLDSGIQDNQKTRLLCGLLLAVCLLAAAVRRRSLLPGAYDAIFLLLLFSPVVHPWYVAWLVVLLPLWPAWSGTLYAATASLTALTVLEYQVTGNWVQPGWVLVVEYLPVVIAWLYEQRSRKVRV